MIVLAHGYHEHECISQQVVMRHKLACALLNEIPNMYALWFSNT